MQSSAVNMPSSQCCAKTRFFSPPSGCKLVEISRNYYNSYRREAGGTNDPADCPLITAKSGHSFSCETAKPKNELGDIGEIICIYKTWLYGLPPASECPRTRRQERGSRGRPCGAPAPARLCQGRSHNTVQRFPELLPRPGGWETDLCLCGSAL